MLFFDSFGKDNYCKAMTFNSKSCTWHKQKKWAG